MFSTLTGTVSSATGLPVNAIVPPVDIPIVDDLVETLPIPADLTELTDLIPGLSGVLDVVKNLKWDIIVNTVKTTVMNLVPKVKSYIEAQLEPYKEYFKKHKILMIFVAIVVGLCLIPVVLYLALVLITIGIGLVVFLLIVGIVLAVGFVVMVAAIIVIILASLLVGAVVIGVIYTFETLQEWSGSEEADPPKDGPDETAASAEPDKKNE